MKAILTAACAAAVKAEIDNRDLSDKKLLPTVESYPDATVVFERLERASSQNHLPAFQRCAGCGERLALHSSTGELTAPIDP